MTSNAAATSASAATEPSQFTLQILSPSVGVPQPLTLENLPVTTTVRQLKERIRNSVSTKPPDDAQRLIHRGRLLARDTETMLELFGEEPLRSADRQALHLVLRDLSEGQVATPTPPPLSNQQANSRSPTPGQHHHHQHQHHHGQPHVRIGTGGPVHPNIAFGLAQAPPQTGGLNGTQLPPGWSPQQHLQNHLQMMARLGLPNQHQTQNPAPQVMGHHGTQNRATPGSTTPGRTGSPLPPEGTRTIIREGIGPDGQRWRFTVNETVVTSTQRIGWTGSPLASAEVPTPLVSQPRSVPSAGPTGGQDFQNILRAADTGSATRTITDAMRRNASSSSLANLASHHGQQPIAPGVTTPLIPSRTGSAAGTPDPLRVSGRPTNASVGVRANQTSSTTPEVYILSSPSGPRAILFNGDLGMYHSPQLRGHQPIGLPLPPMSFNITSGSAPYAGHGVPPQIIQRSITASGNAPNLHPNNGLPVQQAQVQPQQGLQLPAQLPPQFGHGMDNPQIQAVRIAQVWPHIWMIIRLALFIWWFTSPTSSWSRWITVVSVAAVLFIVNTGVLNPFAEQIWVPLRRHLENLIPLAADAGAGQRQRPIAENAQGGDGNAANPARPRDPDPADAAVRLVQQRRQDNANWLLNQARRLERAGILFIASLAPGLAERHIAQVEAEARAERQRQQEAEAAATASVIPATPENTSNDPPTASHEASQPPSTNEHRDSGLGSSGGEAQQSTNVPAPDEPLIAT